MYRLYIKMSVSRGGSNADRKNINCFGGRAFDDHWLGLFIGTMLSYDYKKCDVSEIDSFWKLVSNKSFSSPTTGDKTANHQALIDTIVTVACWHRLIDQSTNTSQNTMILVMKYVSEEIKKNAEFFTTPDKALYDMLKYDNIKAKLPGLSSVARAQKYICDTVTDILSKIDEIAVLKAISGVESFVSIINDYNNIASPIANASVSAYDDALASGDPIPRPDDMTPVSTPTSVTPPLTPSEIATLKIEINKIIDALSRDMFPGPDFTKTYNETNTDVLEFVKCICNFWATDDVSRELYSSYLEPLILDDSSSRGMLSGHAQYYRPMYISEMTQLCATKMEGTDDLKDRVRFNLRKDRRSGDVLFQTCIPDVQSDKNVFCFTCADGSVKSVTLGERDLREIYRLVYNHDSEVIDSAYYGTSDYKPMTDNIKKKSDWFRYSRPSGPYGGLTGGSSTTLKIILNDSEMMFEIDYKKRCASIFKSWKKFNHSAWLSQVLTKPVTSGTVIDLEKQPHLATETVDENGVKWKWDKTKKQYYYLDKDGKQKTFDHINVQSKQNCYETYLTQDGADDDTCRSIMDCIASNNPKKLYNCIKTISSDNSKTLFEAAVLDINRQGRHNPAIIQKILATFAVPKEPTTTLNVPCSYNEWRKNISTHMRENDVHQKVIDEIKKNEPLLSYIRGLITMCRNNPAILNREKASNNGPPENTYQSKLAAKTYRDPYAYAKASNFTNNILAAVNKEGADRFWNTIVSDVYGNGVYLTPSNMATVASSMFPMAGGGSQQNKNSNGFTIVYNSIKSHLKELGLNIHDDDETSINEAVMKVDKLNTALAKQAEILMRLVRLARAYGLKLNRDEPVQNIKLKDVGTVRDVDNFLRRHALKIRTDMISNYKTQHNIYNDFYGNAVSTLLGADCDDDENSDDSDTSKRYKYFTDKE